MQILDSQRCSEVCVAVGISMGLALAINAQVYRPGLPSTSCTIQFATDEPKHQLVYQLNEGTHPSSRERFGNYGIANGFV